MKEAEENKRRFDSMMSRMDEQEAKIEEQNAKIEEQNNRLAEMRPVLNMMKDGYLRIRNRFLNVYCRDVLGVKIHPRELLEGNAAAHHEDAAADTLLYQKDMRRDEELLIQLYELNSSQIQQIGKCWIVL